MRLLTIVAALLSAQAYAACPNLAGSFSCTFSDGTVAPLNIAQDTKDGVTVYNMDNNPIAADGIVYNIPDSDMLKSGTFKASCDTATDTFSTELTGQYYQNASLVGDLNLVNAYTSDGTNLTQNTTGKIVGSFGEYPISESTVCTPVAATAPATTTP